MQDTTLDADNEVVYGLMRLFEGYADAYGTYRATDSNELKGGKLEIKATARTVREPVTVEAWVEHFTGKSPLGIIPIRENNTCLWGCIDVDYYDLDYDAVLTEVAVHKLPLVACRSKSGGIHLFLFMASPAPAADIQARLKEMAVLLGYGNCEVFPKQRSVALDRGDLGSWLNMPYFGGEETDRYGIKDGGLAMTPAEFVNYAESRQQPLEFLSEANFRKRPAKDPDFGDGPPCMQHLAATGFPEGTRNKGLFALGVFAKKKYGPRWPEVLERWNRDYINPPLPATEVMAIQKSLEKKDYFYTCKETPLAQHCNSSLCRTRKFGVGGEDDFPIISGMSVLDSDPPLWFVDVNDQRLELNTEQLQKYNMFHMVCMERLHTCFRMMKASDWLQVVSAAMRDAVRIEASPEVGDKGQFFDLLESFLMDRHRAQSKDEILLGKPWQSPRLGRHFFRLNDLMTFLERANFRRYSRNQITTRIKELGGDRYFFNIKGIGTNVWFVPEQFKPVPKIDLPDVDEDPI